MSIIDKNNLNLNNNLLLKPVSLSDIKGSIIYFDNIITGFDNFNNILLQFLDYNNYIDFIYNMFSLDLNNNITGNGDGVSDKKYYFDFYYSRLSEQELNKFNGLCRKYDINFNIDNIDNNNIYFEFNYLLSEFYSTIDFIAKLSYYEILFSSFYISNPKLTVWTSYEGKIIIFFKDLENLGNNKNNNKNNNMLDMIKELALKYKAIIS